MSFCDPVASEKIAKLTEWEEGNSLGGAECAFVIQKPFSSEAIAFLKEMVCGLWFEPNQADTATPPPSNEELAGKLTCNTAVDIALRESRIRGRGSWIHVALLLDRTAQAEPIPKDPEQTGAIHPIAKLRRVI